MPENLLDESQTSELYGKYVKSDPYKEGSERVNG